MKHCSSYSNTANSFINGTKLTEFKLMVQKLFPVIEQEENNSRKLLSVSCDLHNIVNISWKVLHKFKVKFLI